MPESPMSESHKRALIAAYYLSRFDRKGVRALGYSNFTSAFEHIGTTLAVKPSTVKHMRDSFDPYCSQVRMGWYQRKILPSRANVIQAYDALSESAMTQIIQEIIAGADTAELYIAPITLEQDETEELIAEDNVFANRQRTGDRAEQFFMEVFPTLTHFQGTQLEDTRKLGIGFDFRASSLSELTRGKYEAIEVKGVLEPQGYISFTDKEWSIAKIFRGRYILALVRALDYTPSLELVFDPSDKLSVIMRSYESISIYWNVKV